jgi:hypothetical protein
MFGRDLNTEENSVRGTLVTGLTKRDIDLLDVFEGGVCIYGFSSNINH